MSVPIDMTSKTLNALKGWPNMHAVDFVALFDSDVEDPVYAGSVVSLNESGDFVLGVGTDAVMPMFLFATSTDPDQQNEAPDASTVRGAYVPIVPTGECMALVAVNALEMTSTAYSGDDEDFPPNTPLTSPKTGDNAGLLVPGTLYTDMVVGIVSRGVVNNGYGHDAVAFWPIPVFPS